MNHLLKVAQNILFLSLLVLTVTTENTWAQPTIKMMSYNIYHGENPQESGISNLKEIAELIRREQPDFVALQEVDSLTGRSASLNGGRPQNQVQVLAEMTGMHGYFGKAINFDGGGYGEGILSRNPVEIRKVMLPIPEGGEKRALLIAESEGMGGRPFFFAGTHLCHQFAENRKAQVQQIITTFINAQVPVFLAGDLNFIPDSEPYRLLQQNWIDIALKDGGPALTYSHQNPTKRIDYLFMSEAAEQQFIIEEVKVLEVPYSDHRPIVATLRWRD